MYHHRALIWNLYLNRIQFSSLVCTFIYTAGYSESNQIFCSAGEACVIRMNNFNKRCTKPHAWTLQVSYRLILRLYYLVICPLLQCVVKTQGRSHNLNFLWEWQSWKAPCWHQPDSSWCVCVYKNRVQRDKKRQSNTLRKICSVVSYVNSF